MSKFFCHGGNDGNKRDHETKHELGEKIYLPGMKACHQEQMLTTATFSMVVYASKVISLVHCSSFYK